jgi:hypothetical protein
MSEIKFACPHCSQHIGCDGDYGDLSIECPSCGGTMVVPRLSAVDSAHTEMVIVASTPSPSARVARQIPTLGLWSDEKRAEHHREVTGEVLVSSPLWIMGLFATLVVAFVLMVRGHSFGQIVGCLLLGGIITGMLRARARGSSGAKSVISGLLFGVALLIITPIIAVGILFVGCTACR